MPKRDIARGIELLCGVGLVAFGGLFALAELAGGRAWELIWPLFIIVPGVLLIAGMAAFGRTAGFLAVPGTILVAGGLVLLLTNSLDAWAVWSYAWALVVPGAVGLGLWVYGVWSGLPALRRVGAVLGITGLALFASLAAVLELTIGVSGHAGQLVVHVLAPVALVLVGGILVYRSFGPSG